MIKENKFAILALLIGGIFGVIYIPKQGGGSKKESDGKYQEFDSDKSSSRDSRRVSLSSRDGRSKGEIQIDRSTPERALNVAIDYLRNSDFKGFFTSFSEKGRRSFVDGVELDDDQLELLGGQLEEAGFGNIEVISSEIEEEEGGAKGESVLKSLRSGLERSEVLVLEFSLEGGQWFVDKFEIKFPEEK